MSCNVFLNFYFRRIPLITFFIKLSQFLIKETIELSSMFLLLIWYKRNKNMKIFGSKPLEFGFIVGISSLWAQPVFLPVIA
jgi:hypothetical protein